MSNELMPPQPKKGRKDPFLEKFEVESDARLLRFFGVFALLGVGMISYILTTDMIIPTTLTQTIRGKDTATTVVKMEDIKKVEEEKKKKEEKKKPPKVRKRGGAGGKPRGKGNPNAPVTQAALKMITSRSTSSSLSSYDLLSSKFSKDLDKVINNVSGLTKSGATRLGGRKGKIDGAFNEGYAVGGSGGVDDLLGGLWGGDGSGGLSLTAKGGLGLKAPSASDIDLGQESGQRSTESILRVIRQHTPGLRHTFNKFLKLNPGFKGKVTLKFTIAPSGAIVDLAVVSSTTGVPDFDKDVRDKVKTWRFEPVKGRANDVVTVPFTFSE